MRRGVPGRSRSATEYPAIYASNDRLERQEILLRSLNIFCWVCNLWSRDNREWPRFSVADDRCEKACCWKKQTKSIACQWQIWFLFPLVPCSARPGGIAHRFFKEIWQNMLVLSTPVACDCRPLPPLASPIWATNSCLCLNLRRKEKYFICRLEMVLTVYGVIVILNWMIEMIYL